MKELRNVVDDKNFERLQNDLFSWNIPWYLSGTYTSTQYENLINIDASKSPDFSFAHLVYLDGDVRSELYEPLSKIILNGLDKIGEQPNELIRIKVNMCTCQPNLHINPPHVDTNETHKAGLIYMNTTNAPTFLYNETFNPRFGFSADEYFNKILNSKVTIKQKVECEANKMITFDGKYYHASSVQSDTYRRIVVNFNYR
jgi:hypothetical protein